MTEPRFSTGDEVVFVDGDFEGAYGIVRAYEETLDLYLIDSAEVSPVHVIVAPEEVLDFYDAQVDKDPPPATPAFGVSPLQLAAYADRTLDKVLDRVLDGSEQDYDEQGYQRWEAAGLGSALGDVLHEVEGYIASGIRLHLLISRIQSAAEGN